MSNLQQTEDCKMSLFVCIKCPLTGYDIGEWDSEHSLFKNILKIHKLHKGFKQGIIPVRKTIEDAAIEFMNKNYHRMLHVLIHSYKGPTKSCLLRGALDEI
jgi:hypothetical protein